MNKEIERIWLEWFNNQPSEFTDQEPEVISKQAFNAGYKIAQQKRQKAKIIVELYVCEKCSRVENELNGDCPECGSTMKCVDFVPKEN